jgi:hypothetical protein
MDEHVSSSNVITPHVPMPLHELVLNCDCSILPIGDKKGYWGYIDFINERELGKKAVMKGVDCIGRPFLVVKAEFVLESGATVPLFATLFQKYVNNKNIWQCYNYEGMELFQTSYIGDGCPVSDKQVALLQQLMYEQKIDLLNSDLSILAEHKTESVKVSLQLRRDRVSSYY